jgi:hypothetical protein
VCPGSRPVDLSEDYLNLPVLNVPDEVSASPVQMVRIGDLETSTSWTREWKVDAVTGTLPTIFAFIGPCSAWLREEVIPLPLFAQRALVATLVAVECVDSHFR